MFSINKNAVSLLILSSLSLSIIGIVFLNPLLLVEIVSAGPLADIFSTVLTGIFIFFEMKKLDEHHKSTIVSDVGEIKKELYGVDNIVEEL